MDIFDPADVLRSANDAYRGGFRVTAGAAPSSASQILNRSREAAQRDIAVAALKVIASQEGYRSDKVAARDALEKIAEIEKTRPKAER